MFHVCVVCVCMSGFVVANSTGMSKKGENHGASDINEDKETIISVVALFMRVCVCACFCWGLEVYHRVWGGE